MSRKRNKKNLHRNEEIKKKRENPVKYGRHNNLISGIIELVIVAVLISIGSSATVQGLVSLYYPCSGNICGEIYVAGGVTLTIGLILIFSAALIILWVNALKD